MQRSCLIPEDELREDIAQALKEELRLSVKQFIKFLNSGMFRPNDRVVEDYVYWIKKLPEGKEITNNLG
jgi:ribosomal protein S19E (S16A)